MGSLKKKGGRVNEIRKGKRKNGASQKKKEWGGRNRGDLEVLGSAHFDHSFSIKTD